MKYKVTHKIEEFTEAASIEDARAKFPNAVITEIEEPLDLKSATEAFKKAKEQIAQKIEANRQLEIQLHEIEAKKFENIMKYLYNEVVPLVRMFKKQFVFDFYKNKKAIIKDNIANGTGSYWWSLSRIAGEPDGSGYYAPSAIDGCGSATIEPDSKYYDYGVLPILVRHWDEIKPKIELALVEYMQDYVKTETEKVEKETEKYMNLLNENNK